ncbi:hypothetical protein CK203_105894 [Vitis vinifera]|uniref:Integrase catalytic domain-containing protein n=1 Tax=Vitis vinifera TaxID=29760 RepID=A0A438EI84_VITVI|nr:hypothetical protein CK203_105894 [Vitis vinifera]
MCNIWLRNSPGECYHRIRICLSDMRHPENGELRSNRMAVVLHPKKNSRCHPGGTQQSINSGCEVAVADSGCDTSGWKVGNSRVQSFWQPGKNGDSRVQYVQDPILLVFWNCLRIPMNSPQSWIALLHVLTSPWPFSIWGIDIIGKVSPKSSSGHEFILVAIDYFTKWVEAASYARLTSARAASFIKSHIICHYGVPHELISDRGVYFQAEVDTLL